MSVVQGPLQQLQRQQLLMMLVIMLITLWSKKIAEAKNSLHPFNPEVFPEQQEAYRNDPVELPADGDALLEKALSLPIGM